MRGDMDAYQKKEFKDIAKTVEDDITRRNILWERYDVLEEEIKHLKARMLSADKARVIIQNVAKETQQNLEFHISKLVTTAIVSVFPDEIQFVTRIEIRRKKTECDLLFKEYDQEYDPLKGSGYGPVDVSSFSLRISFWSLNRNRPTMILDEPFRNVSPDLQYKVSEMLKMISERLNIQIIMVSHQEDVNIAADKTFLAKKVGKLTQIEEII